MNPTPPPPPRSTKAINLACLLEANPRAVQEAQGVRMGDVALAALHAARTLARPVTVAELAARLDEPIVRVATVAWELLGLQQVRRVPSTIELRHRLRSWTYGTTPEPSVRVDTLLLVGGPDCALHRALGQISSTGPLAVDRHLPGRMWVGSGQRSPDHHVLMLAASGLGEDDARWQDLLRETSGAVAVVTAADLNDETSAPLARPLVGAGVPLVAMVAVDDAEDEPNADLVRACLGLPEHTPVQAGDVRFAPDVQSAMCTIGARA